SDKTLRDGNNSIRQWRAKRIRVKAVAAAIPAYRLILCHVSSSQLPPAKKSTAI
ncbi:unnamed protein product, partial [Prunus brigantina]